jgi:hypothetical protein
MAQDFAQAFGTGDSDRLINSIDADGVGLAAIQVLYKMVQQQKNLIQRQRAELNAMQQELSATQARLMSIEAALREPAASPDS